MTTAAEQLERLYRHSGQAVRATDLSAETAEPLYRNYLDFVQAHVPGGRLLDVGCGAGWSTYLFARRGYEATGLDLNGRAFEPPRCERLSFLAGNACDLPFADGTFDVSAAYQALEHVSDPDRMLGEMIRVVRPGGVVCVVGPNLLSLSSSARALGYHVWRNRPLGTAFRRTPDMPCHPFGNTLPEVLGTLGLNLGRILRKSLRSRPEFTLRAPDLRPPFHADNDAVYLCNPLDLGRYFRACGCAVLRECALGRRPWTRMIAGGTWVAARLPNPSPDPRP